MKYTASVALSLAVLAGASPVELVDRQNNSTGGGAGGNCPKVFVFGARETSVPQTSNNGFGSAGPLVSQVVAAFPGAGSQAIVYPACGGQASCGNIAYNDSANKGTSAVVEAVNAYVAKCPNTDIVLIGYSQGGQIMDNAICGGGGSSLSSTAAAAVKAAIFMGDPHNIAGLPYNIGTCKAHGFAARPAGFTCANPSVVQSYCDSADPFCCTGNDASVHQGYVAEYGSQAMTFIKSKISA